MGGSDGIDGQGLQLTHAVCGNGQRGGLGQMGQVVLRILEAQDASKATADVPLLSREDELTEILVKPWSLVCNGFRDA
jgi:hypothetical protein